MDNPGEKKRKRGNRDGERLKNRRLMTLSYL